MNKSIWSLKGSTLTVKDVHLGPKEFNINRINLVYVDIDGTIADLTHRRHWLMDQPKNWKAFEANVMDDTPIHDVIKLVNLLSQEAEIVLTSGRNENTRVDTMRWLEDNGVPYSELHMRPSKDFQHDGTLKAGMHKRISVRLGDPDLILDDRDRVVAAWRELKLPVVQVAEGDF